jgi:hypothetical protein
MFLQNLKPLLQFRSLKAELTAKAFAWVRSKSNHHVYPWGWVTCIFHRFGVEFPWNGDGVIWTWPWMEPTQRKTLGKYISITFTGDAKLGPARYKSLAMLDRAWNLYLSTYASKQFSIK